MKDLGTVSLNDLMSSFETKLKNNETEERKRKRVNLFSSVGKDDAMAVISSYHSVITTFSVGDAENYLHFLKVRKVIN